MLVPALFRDSFFDDWMLPALREAEDVDHKLYGKHAARVMKTDVQEKDDGYIVDIDLPGFKKDELSLDLRNGYLTVSASKGLDKDEKDKAGKLIRQERYAGAMQRSFYVGEELTAEDIGAKFENGVLSLTLPKKDAKKLPEHRQIEIEG